MIPQVAAYKAQLEGSGWEFEMKISFVEIYCEQIKDLLADPSVDHKPSDYKITKVQYPSALAATDALSVCRNRTTLVSTLSRMRRWFPWSRRTRRRLMTSCG
jgi:hypothetical protein